MAQRVENPGLLPQSPLFTKREIEKGVKYLKTPENDTQMGNKVFCGGLAWGTNDGSLKTAMEQYGPVQEVKIIMDRDTGKSKGFGFVTFVEDEGAQAAVKAETVEIDGRSVRMDLAKERAPRSGGGGGGGGGGGSRGGSGPGGRGSTSSQNHGGGGQGYESDRGGGGGGGRDKGSRGKRRDKGGGGGRGGGGYNEGGGYSSGGY